MPRTLLEAMAMNMPIVSTNVGSIEGIIIDNENGLLIESVRDMNEYVEMINSLLNNISLRTFLSSNAYSNAVQNYEWNSIFDRYRLTLRNLH
ncbi:MAG: glycosyltransferase [Saprospiraceae bacterium]|nr:glycosyltransferase [Saprospiraceae bacterium]